MKSRILQICVLLVCCLASSLLTWQYASSYFDKYYTELVIEMRSKQVFPVVYCRKTIPANTTITSEYLELRCVPENILPASAMESVSDVVGRKSNSTIKKGDAIFVADFEELKSQFPNLNLRENNSLK